MTLVLGSLAALVTLVTASVLVSLGLLGRHRIVGHAGLLLVSLGLFQGSMLVPGPWWPLVVSAAAGVVYMAWAPPFYHQFLGLPLGPRTKTVYAALWGAFSTLAFLVCWPPFAPLLPGVLALFFGMVAWGVVLIVYRLGQPQPLAGLSRRFLGRFALGTAAALPFLVLDIVGTLGQWSWMVVFDNLSLPVFLVALDALILFEARRWTTLPGRPSEGATPLPPPASDEAPLLTPRELTIATRILEGASAKEIASALDLSAKTVENHTYRIYQKFGVRSRLQFYHKVHAQGVPLVSG